MTQFLALLRLQLLSRYADLRPGNLRRLAPAERKKTIGKMFLYAFLLIYLGGFLFYLETRIIDLLLKMGPPPIGLANLMVILAVSVSMLGTLVMSFFFVMSSLFLGRDSAFLASLPLKPRTVLGARLCQVWISETGINALVLLPACILFGIKTGAGAGFYFRMVLVWLSSSLLPICVAAVLSTLLIRVSVLLRHREAILTVGGLVLMVLYFGFAMSVGSITGDTGAGGEMLVNLLTSNSARIQQFSQAFPPVGWAVRGMLGDWGQLLLFFASGLAAMAVLIAVLGIFYRRLSLLQSEAPVATGKKGLQKGSIAGKGSALTALMKREIRQILRVPSYATNILPVCMMPALMIVMMGLFIFRDLGKEGETLEMALQQIPGVLTVGVLFLLISFMADLNPALSTAVSREGRGHDFMLGLPVSPRTHILSKLLVGYGLSCLGIALSAVALVIFMPAVWKESVLACLLTLLFVFMTSCLSLARDVKKPRLNWVTEQEAVKQNMGLLLSMLVSFAILAAEAIIGYVLIAELNLEFWPTVAIMALINLLGGWLSYRYLMKTGDRYYTNRLT